MQNKRIPQTYQMMIGTSIHIMHGLKYLREYLLQAGYLDGCSVGEEPMNSIISLKRDTD